MKIALMTAFALALLALQAALLAHVGGGLFSLALGVPCVLFLSLQAANNVEGAVGAALVGYLMDLMNGGPKGLMTFLAVLLFLVARFVGAAIDVRSRVAVAFLTAVMTAAHELGALLLTRLVSSPESAPGFRLLGRIAVEAILTGACAPLVFWGLRRIDGMFTREEQGLLR